MPKMELHIHTRYSADSLLPLWLLHSICKRKQIACIAITDHNEIKGALQFQKLYKDIKTIVGEEIFTSEGEIIGLYLTERIKPGLTPQETIHQIRLQNGLVYIPHPSDTKRRRSVLSESFINEQRFLIDCIEEYNGRTLSDRDILEQRRIAYASDLCCAVVGSDAHTAIELGRTYMIVQSLPDNSRAFVSIVSASEKYKAPCIPQAHRITKFSKGLKLLLQGEIVKLFRKLRSNKDR